MDKTKPLILTLKIDETSQHLFNTLREKYFPADRNYLKAHLTLFHHLPPDESKVQEDLLRWSSMHSPLALQISEVKSIGKGVAYKVDSQALLQLHTSMQATWRHWLKPQDKQRLWPHVTVQNKVTAETAKQTLVTLSKAFQPFTATGLGFSLWSYEGGPWVFINDFLFTGQPTK